MASIFNRKKQLLKPFVEGLITDLTDFKEDDKHYEEVSKFVYQNLIHHNYATVDITTVQKSIDGMVEKFRVHGLGRRGKHFLELVNNYLHSDTSHHSQLNVQWYVLLLLLRLSNNPTKVTEEELQASVIEKRPQSPESELDLIESLKEVWNEYQPPEDVSDESEWSSESGEEDEVADGLCEAVSELPGYGLVPHPSLWHTLAPPCSSHQLLRSVLREASESEHWLKQNVQSPYWHCPHQISLRQDKSNISNLSGSSRDSLSGPSTQVLSEFKVMKEVLWLLQVAGEGYVFLLNEKEEFFVRPNLTLSHTSPSSLQSSLEELCSYMTMLRCMQEFIRQVDVEETSDCQPPFTYKAYSSVLSQQLDKLTALVLHMQIELNKQERVMTLVSIVEELSPMLNMVQYLYHIHIRAVTDWRSEPSWLCASRLLSVLYKALLEASNEQHLETCLELFLHSFRIYLKIIHVWLSEGRLEDWRKEFLVIREEESVVVQPYMEAMARCKVSPVSLLSKLVTVVSEAGRTVQIISQLNKLTQLRNIVHNKGCLVKEFSANVVEEINQLKKKADKVAVAAEDSDSEDSASFLSAETSSHLDTQELLIDKTAESEAELQKLFSADNASVGVSTPFPSLMGDGEGESRAGQRTYFTAVSSKYLYTQMMTSLLDNPLLKEAMKRYLPEEPTLLQSRPATPLPAESPVSSCARLTPNSSVSLVGLMSIRTVLERQLDLIVARHKQAAMLVKNTLCTDYQLPVHFTVLRTIFFMENGILAQSFYAYLFKEMESSFVPSSVSLNVHLQLTVEEFFPGFGNHFTVQMSNGNKDLGGDFHRAIQNISLDYAVDWPVSLVVSQDSIASYNKVFRFLLHLKHSYWTLHNLRFSDLKENGKSPKARRLQGLKVWMFHSTNTLHTYFMVLLQSFSSRLQQAVHLAESIDDIVEAHLKFLNEVKARCLQDKGSFVEKFIMKLLRLCSNLAQLWEDECTGRLTEEDLASLEKLYVNNYHALEHCLQAFLNDANTEHPLCELYGEFSHSPPEFGSLNT